MKKLKNIIKNALYTRSGRRYLISLATPASKETMFEKIDAALEYSRELATKREVLVAKEFYNDLNSDIREISIIKRDGKIYMTKNYADGNMIIISGLSRIIKNILS